MLLLLLILLLPLSPLLLPLLLLLLLVVPTVLLPCNVSDEVAPEIHKVIIERKPSRSEGSQVRQDT